MQTATAPVPSPQPLAITNAPTSAPPRRADRVEGVEGGHGRLAAERLDLGGLDVADDVEPAHQQAEEEEGDEEERDVAGEDRERNGRHIENHAGRRRNAGPDMADRPAHDRHGSTAPPAITSNAEAEDRRADPEALLDERDVDRPEAGSGAKKEKGDGNRHPRPEGEGVAIGGGSVRLGVHFLPRFSLAGGAARAMFRRAVRAGQCSARAGSETARNIAPSRTHSRATRKQSDSSPQ